MSEQELGFICFQKDDKGRVYGARTGHTIESAEKIQEDENEEGQFIKDTAFDSAPSNDKNDENEPSNATVPTVCYSTMRAVDKLVSPYHPLIELTTMFRHGMQKAGLEGGLYKYVKDNCVLQSTSDTLETYQISPDNIEAISGHMSQIQEVDEGMRILPSSILLSLVATFDSVIGDFARQILTLNPNKLESSQQTLTYRELFSLQNLEATRQKLIEDEVGNLLRGSHQKQVEYLEGLSETKIIDHYERWPNFIEIFERRNAYAHTNGRASATYVENLNRVKCPHETAAGDELRLSTSYLHKSVDILTEFITILAFVTWRKLGNETEEAFGALSNASYTHITKKRYLLAIKLLDFALNRQSRKGASERIIRQMHINLANAYKKNDDKGKMQKTLDGQDWSAASVDFKICIACLNDDAVEVARLLPMASASGDITKESVRDWPVFDWVRDDEAVIEAFQQCFGEQLIPTSDSGRQDMPEKLEDAGAKATKH